MTVERNGFQIRDPQLQEGRIHVLEVGAIREAKLLGKNYFSRLGHFGHL